MTLWRGRRGPGGPPGGALFFVGGAKTTTVAAAPKEPGKARTSGGAGRLEPKAPQRLELETAAVTDSRTVPYGALIYDTKGGVSVYTVPEPLLYIREAVK